MGANVLIVIVILRQHLGAYFLRQLHLFLVGGRGIGTKFYLVVSLEPYQFDCIPIFLELNHLTPQ